MGSWFLKYFAKSKGTELLAFDIKRSTLTSSRSVTICESVEQCTLAADLVLLCVPISEIPDMVRKCGSLMKQGSTLAEISSVKYYAHKALKGVNRKINLLCIHPMFGPGEIHLGELKILMIPVNNKNRELQILTRLFRGANIIEIPNALSHDRYVALTVGLVYYINILFSYILPKGQLHFLKKISGTTFTVQSLLSESILTDDALLISSLLLENPFAMDLVHRFNVEATRLGRLIRVGNSSRILSLVKDIKSNLSIESDLRISYQKMYAIAKLIKKYKLERS